MERRLANPRISETVAREIEQRILEGSYRTGDRLPPERELAQQWGVSRASLREAIRVLVSRGLLASRQGEGTFVTDRLDAGFTDPWEAMLQEHPSVREDMLEFRHLLEAKAAECAAIRATGDDRERLRLCHQRLEAAFSGDDLDEQVERDVAFHQAIAEAAHNAIIGHLTASLLRLMRDHIRRNLGQLVPVPEALARLREQHRTIWQAIESRSPEAARAAAATHIDFVRQRLAESLRAEAWRESAHRRLQDS
ncbi:MAG: FCD domain-containing protein [Rhodocyclaceae bacterium]|nr:FCD domain-containing protein [Rhodocyclaceae bacterium]